MNFERVKGALKEGWEARLPQWESCRTIRAWKDSDADYFVHDIPANTEDAIVMECERQCDCKVGIYAPAKEEVESDQWFLVNNK